METHKIYRHGDVSLTKINEIPKNCKLIGDFNKYILAFGEVTGHKHLLTAEPTAEFEVLQDSEGRYYLKLEGTAKLTHEEHKEIIIEKGLYFVGNEREYNYFELQSQRVVD